MRRMSRMAAAQPSRVAAWSSAAASRSPAARARASASFISFWMMVSNALPTEPLFVGSASASWPRRAGAASAAHDAGGSLTPSRSRTSRL